MAEGEKKVDVVIVGAGPAGCSCALGLEGSGLNVTLLEKEVFPRDKVCGDALGWDVIRQLKMFSGPLFDSFAGLEEKVAIHGFEIRSPSHHVLRKMLHSRFGGLAAGYVMKRRVFDHFLLSEVQRRGAVDVHLGVPVVKVEPVADGVRIEAADMVFLASLVVAADGMGSLVRKHLMKHPVDHRHDWLACRAYFHGISFPEGDAALEFHFLRDVLPGYVWIFPSGGGGANVGAGMPARIVKRKGIRLQEYFEERLLRHPSVEERFGKARRLGDVQLYPIPMFHKKIPLSGERFLLAGDAAGLVNPLTGEGIGNAIRSGRIAAWHIRRGAEGAVFTASFNKGYDREIYARMGRGLRLSLLLQHALYRPWLIDAIVRLADNKRWMKKWLMYLFDRL